MKRHTGLGSIAAIGCAILFALVAGCSKPSDSSTSSTNSGATTNPSGIRLIRIGMVAKSESNDVFQAAHSGAVDEAKNLSIANHVDIEILWRTPPDEDASAQADAIRELADEKVDGITVSCSEAARLTTAINDAVDKGVPVVCFDSDAPDSKRFADYGTDDMQCGQVIVRELAKYMNEQGTIAILAGHEGSPNLTLRIKGAEDELAKHPNMKLLDNGVFYNEEVPEKAAETVTQAMLSNQGKIDGWAMIGGWPLFTDHALDSVPSNVKVVSCDALPKQLAYLRSGQVQALVAQDCYGWGTQTVDLLVNKILNNQLPDNPKIPNPLTIVTVAKPDPNIPPEPNVRRMALDDFAGYWDQWLKK
ncbi:MAG: substrate-binding domain-containing protein [Tepidisphaeraceae bacterium]|jgi:ribose transport system substrate-binding protein